MSSGLFNSAATLGMVVTGTLPPIRGLVQFPVQNLGAICAAAVVSCTILSGIAIVQTTLEPDMSVVRELFLEMVCDYPHNRHLQNYNANFCSASS
jgi:aquaporin related protein